MDNTGSFFKSAILNFRKWGSSYRIPVVFLMEFLYLYICTQNGYEFLQEQNIGITSWFFVFWSGGFYARIIMFLGVILLFCNAPFTDEQQMFVMLRVGKVRWFMGQILYIILASICYFGIIVLMTIFRFFPYIGFSLEWGDALRNGSMENIFSASVPLKVLEQFSPIQAFGYAFGISVGVGIVFGLLILLINMHKESVWGIGIAVTWVAASLFIVIFPQKTENLLKYVAITEWCDLHAYMNGMYSISLAYTIPSSVVLIVILIIGILLSTKKYNIRIVENV